MRLELVEWEDISATTECVDFSEASETPGISFITAGYVIREIADAIWLAQTLGSHDAALQGSPCKADHIYRIPKVVVKMRIRLVPSGLGEWEYPYASVATREGGMSRFHCPQCGAPEVLRDRHPNGNSKCKNGNTYPSRDAVELESMGEADRERYAKMVKQNIVHIYPAAETHDTEGINCWCLPHLSEDCVECEGSGQDEDGGTCWLCKGEGVIDAKAEDADDPDGPTLYVIHHKFC